ncbi:MAG: anti-sigma regulatory factor [Deltaproteobacteria bacterium]|nr:anti-sigma regulatory factor [Deltaproteobacteria bacterium]MBW2595448.1 anti-sigma regulatory factor [Deltaproteobacteria bacterium]MBW2650052.1 anti-sigma regulatory factor [Deltaproteobacteria bacterium]
MSQKCEFSFPVEGENFDDAGKVSVEIKRLLKGLGITGDILRRTAIATYESEVNIISYAWQGTIDVRVTDDNILINIQDSGPGIIDIEQAMQQGYSTANDRIREMGFGAGMGLFNIKNCSDGFEILSEINKGTLLKILINR